MRRPLIVIAGILVAVAPAIANEAALGAGRYQIAPAEDGFTRLDTATGSISHCGKRAGVWQCEPLDTTDDALRVKLDELSGAVERLSDDLDVLGARVEALAARLDALANRTAANVRSTPEEQARRADEALNFAEKVMRRFFDLVREMKRAEEGDRI